MSARLSRPPDALPRVAYVISTRGVAGAERFLGALVKEGGARGWDQLVLNPFAGEAAPDLERLFQPARYLPLPCSSARSVPGLRRRLRAELEVFRPDVVHVMLWHALVLVATLRRSSGQHWVTTNMYGSGISRIGAGDRRRSDPVRAAVDKWAGRRFELVFAISESVAGHLVNGYGYPPAKVRCIPLGWEGDPLPPSQERRPPTVVCVALFRPEKGHEVLLDAFALVRERVPDARLVLVGRGELMSRLQARVVELDLEKSVEITGPVPEIWPYLARADVFALASTSEAFGIAVVEAMAAGLPVVASDVGGIPELVDAGVTGELFPPGDHQALADHLVRILTAPEQRARMSRSALAAAEPRRLSATVGRYFDACDELVGS